MRRAIVWLGVLALSGGVWVSGNALLRAALPIAISSLVAGLFANTLRPGRTPLIARAIAAIDGPQWLADPAVARYARRLTWFWAAYLFLLAAIAAVLASTAPASRFGTIGVPLAVAALFTGEFVLRRWLLPQAPRHGFIAFARDLIRYWPALLADRAVVGVSEARCSVHAMPPSVREHFHIAASHPVLPGHFPGNPVVPGVLLLERVAATVKRTYGARVAGLPQVKFLHPLRPDEVAELRIERDGAKARFAIRRGQEIVASGTLELVP